MLQIHPEVRKNAASDFGQMIAIPNVLGILRRRWRTVVPFIVAMLAVALLYIIFATPLYSSTATILVDNRMNSALQKQNIVSDVPVDTAFVDSQANILSSDGIALDVIKILNLTNDPEFIGPPNGLGAFIIYKITSSIKYVLSFIVTPLTEEGSLKESLALQAFSRKLIVKRQELSYLIDVQFSAETPQKSALIANTILDTYMKSDLSAKIGAISSANKWLQDRILQLRIQATLADDRLQKFRAENGIVETDRGLLDRQSLAELSTQLGLARSALTEAKAKLDRVSAVINEGGDDVIVSDALNNPVITRLRSQYMDLAQNRQSLIKRFGEGHEAVRGVNQQISQITKSVAAEQRRIADAYASDFEIAKQRVDGLEKSLGDTILQSTNRNEAQVKARELESSADAARNIYNSYLQKFQETGQAQSIPVNDSRVIAIAQPPIQKSSPKTVLALAAAIIAGLGIGSAYSIASELLNSTYRIPSEIEDDLGLHCFGVTPNLHAAQTGEKRRKISSTMHAWVISAPRSRFAETLRSCYFSLIAKPGDGRATITGVISSVPKEGKSLIASNLAFMAALQGHRVLLVDTDVRERGLTRMLAPDTRTGLIEAVRNLALLDQLTISLVEGKVYFLPVSESDSFVDAATVFVGNSFEKFIHEASGKYDVIILDFAPLLAVTDVQMIEGLVDNFLLVVRWGESRSRLIQEAMKSNDRIVSKIKGVVLNGADPVEMRSLESYKGPSFENYYRDPSYS